MTTIVWIDTETSGLDPAVDEITQIAAIAEIDGRVLDRFETKIEFDLEAASPKALEINSYDAAVWKERAVPQIEGLAALCEWLVPFCDVRMTSKAGWPYQVARTAGHNVRFDVEFLMASCKRHGLFLPLEGYRALDTLQLALWLVAAGLATQPPDFKLGTLLRHFMPRQEFGELHDAMADIEATRVLGRHMLGLFRSMGA